MTKLAKEYKKQLLFYFFYITQTQCENIVFKSKNSLMEEFSKYLEDSDILEEFDKGALGKKTLKEFFAEYQDNCRLIIKIKDHYQLTDIGVIYAKEDIAPNILDKHHSLILEYLDLEYPTYLFSTLSTNETRYPFPTVNEAYSYKNFYWYYRGAEFTRKYQQFHTRFLNDPWKKPFTRVSGPSNSGKSSFLKFLTLYNNRTGLSNNWIEKNKGIFKLKGADIRYNKEIADLEILHDWLAEERFRILKIPKLTQEEESTSSKASDISHYSLLASLNTELEVRNKKLILIIDQGEVLLENLIHDKNNSNIFVTKFLKKIPQYENLALMFSISDEYIGVLEKILDNAESIDLQYDKFLVTSLSSDLIDIIIKNIRIIPFKTEETGFKAVYIHDTQIKLIKDALCNIETFVGTELIILLNELTSKYGKCSGTQIMIPKLSAEDYKNILNRWIQEKIEYRIAADPKASEHWEFLLLQELLVVSMNIAAPFPMNQVEIWYKNHMLYSGNKNPPSLEKIVRNLAKDGLINYNDQFISFKHQYVLKSVKKRLTSEKLRIFQIRSLWKSEIELREIPQPGPFKDAFENLFPFHEVITEEKSRERLALGLLNHHLKVNLRIPTQSFIDSILIHIFNEVDKPGFDLSSLVSLFSSLNKVRERFFVHFQKDEERTSKILGDKFIKILETDFDPDVLTQIVSEINKSDSQLSLDLCNEMTSYIKKEFPAIFYLHIELILLLNNLNEIHPQIISILEEFSWDKIIEITLNDLGSLLENLRTVEEMMLARYKEGKEVQYLNSHDEQKLIENSFVYGLFQKLIEHVKWGELRWETLSIPEIHRFLDQFDRYLKFPDNILLFDWSSFLQKRWQEEAEEILLLIMNKSSFTRRLLAEWPKDGKFPKVLDFVSAHKLGYLTYFVRMVLHHQFIGRNISYKFFNQDEFNIENLKKLMKSSFYPAIHELERMLKESCPTKYSEVKEAFDDLCGNNSFLNRYHQALIALCEKKDRIIDSNPKKLIMNAGNYKNEHSCYWPFLALPSIFDLILVLEKVQDRKEKKELKEEMLKSIKETPNTWNNLFNHHFYIKSFEDFYPGSEKSNYLKKKEHSAYNQSPNLEEMTKFHHLGLSLLLYRLSNDKIMHQVLEALIKHTKYLDYLFHQEYNKLITWKQSFKIPLEYELHFSTSREDVDLNKLKDIITRAVYNSPTEAFFKLFKIENQIAPILMGRIREAKIDDEIKRPKDIISRNPEQFSFVVGQIMKGENTEISDHIKKWMDMFGLTRIEKPLTSLGIGLETLESLRDIPDKDFILEQTPWDLHFSKMTDEEYIAIFSLFEESFFVRRKEKTLYYSFMRGVLENFDRWYEIIIGIYNERYSNSFIAITGLIGKFKLIGNEKHQQLFIKKLQEKLDLENWKIIIEENRKQEDPLREVMDYLETTDHYSELIYQQQKVIEELFSKNNDISSYFKTFWHVSIFTEWLQKKKEVNSKVFSNYMTEFFNQTKKLSFNLEPTGYYGRIGGIVTFLQSPVLILPEIQELITKSDFFKQLREIILAEVQKDSYNFRYIPNIFKVLKKIDQLGIIDRKVYIQEIIEELNLEELLLTDDSRYRLRRIIGPKNESEEFIEVLVNTKGFKLLNWTKVAERTDRFSLLDYHSFIDELKNFPTQLSIEILSNPTFWDIEWIEFINGWLISCDKRLDNIFEFLQRFKEEKSVKKFILSSELILCPWEHCYQKIIQQEKEDSSRLSKDEFEKIFKFLSSINPNFHRLLINISIKLGEDKKTEEE